MNRETKGDRVGEAAREGGGYCEAREGEAENTQKRSKTKIERSREHAETIKTKIERGTTYTALVERSSAYTCFL